MATPLPPNKGSPTPKQSSPTPKQSIPTPKQSSPSPSKGTPPPSKSSPPPSKGTPPPSKSSPSPSKGTPPPPSKGAPLSSKTTPPPNRSASPRKVASSSDVEKLAKDAEKMAASRRGSSGSHKSSPSKPSRSQSIDDIISRDTSNSYQQSKPPRQVDKIVEDSEKEAAQAGGHYDLEEKGTCDWMIDEDYLKAVDKELKPEDKQHRRETAEKMKIEGNDLFKRSLYTEAARSYTAAIRTCPLSFGNERAILYANRAACFLYMNEAEEGIMDCDKSLEINPNYLKALLRRALLYEKDEKLEEALTDYKKVLELEPQNGKAAEACMRLPEEIKERNEKLKTEMLGKLKDLGNMILRPFGLSTDNFKMQQDPSTGSYSINMSQNK